MPRALSQLYIGPLQGLAPPRVSAIPGPGTEAAHDLLDPLRLASRLEHVGAQHANGDRRAVASLWSKWHFSGLMAHGLASNLLLERDLPLALDDLHLETSPNGHTQQFILRHAGRPLAELAPHSRFATLLEGHLVPLVDALVKVSGASPKVFWSNAGNYFEYFSRALVEHPMASTGVSDSATALMESARLPDGRRNPLYRPVRYVLSTDSSTVSSPPRRVRRLCCIRYLIPELEVCANCPLTCRRDPGTTRSRDGSCV
ncbi:siderophore-iron reductase FhuF [Halomonas urumqiensis]|uniref:Siderophore-iron reductase FhuF n=1 Tax=Halomonas urumqiensis TaxID=1684789 RepID=A0A2N7UR30_9GAMM|nr:siderophore-iron reductase FhuF [Halomonas urumqiensis]PMR82871.1 siderophore-iron reductase FhuF [Halomonas urumqiensis]PTB01811.1 siderophore-iron reductase FhuF [Halomonas urumqiensis]GHE21907.1 transporter [Halomonas urumqiensis]